MIAAWLGERKVFGASKGKRTEARAPVAREGGIGPLRWAVAVGSGLLLLLGLLGKGWVEIASVPLVAKLLAAATGG